ncbi:MAG: type I-E CRISPR-associated endonuclease Cas1e [Microthrixaceae bacterium]
MVDLPRVADRVSFLYLDGAVIRQDETGVVAYSTGGNVRIPCASTLVLFLGAGTSISQSAALTLARHGTTVVWTGVEGVGASATVRPLTSSSGLAEAQAAAWADVEQRHRIARRLFLERFPSDEVPSDTDLDTLRGLEGARVRHCYERFRRIHDLPEWRRRQRAEDLDPVNIALNVANAMLYDTAGAVIGALGLSPALGFIHAGNVRAFALDLADLYKTRSSIPSAFACAESSDPGGDVRRSMRSYLADLRIHADMVRVITGLFGDVGSEDKNVIIGEGGYVEGGWSQEDR